MIKALGAYYTGVAQVEFITSSLEQPQCKPLICNYTKGQTIKLFHLKCLERKEIEKKNVREEEEAIRGS